MSGSFDMRPIRARVPPKGNGALTSETPAAVPFRMSTVAENLYRRAHANDFNDPDGITRNKKAVAKRVGGGPPQLLLCYLCGQQFGTASLAIHQSQCYVKKLIQWERMPEDCRGRKPMHPDEYRQLDPEARSCEGSMKVHPGSREAFNDREYAKFSEEMLVPCEGCGRRFLPDRLVVHKRSCKLVGGSMSATSVKRGGGAEENNSSEAPPPSKELVPCSLCGRRYLASKIELHMKLCKGSVPSTSKREQKEEPRERQTDRQQKEYFREEEPASQKTEWVAMEQTTQQSSSPAPPTRTSHSPQRHNTQSHRDPGYAWGDDRPSPRADLLPQRAVEYTAVEPHLLPCRFCNRKFNAARLEKHEGVCTERNKKGNPSRKVSYSYKDPNAPKITPKVRYEESVDLQRQVTPRTRPATELLPEKRSSWNTPPSSGVVRLTRTGTAAVPSGAHKDKTGKEGKTSLHGRDTPRGKGDPPLPKPTASARGMRVVHRSVSPPPQLSGTASSLVTEDDPNDNLSSTYSGQRWSAALLPLQVGAGVGSSEDQSRSVLNLGSAGPKFCQECGFRFPATAKFCQECGFRCR